MSVLWDIAGVLAVVAALAVTLGLVLALAAIDDERWWRQMERRDREDVAEMIRQSRLPKRVGTVIRLWPRRNRKPIWSHPCPVCDRAGRIVPHGGQHAVIGPPPPMPPPGSPPRA